MNSKINGITKVEDYELVREHAILQNLFIMLQKSGSDMKFMKNLLERAYSMAGRIIEDMVLEDSKANRTALKERFMKIHQENTMILSSIYQFTCRGFKDEFGVTRNVLRTEISLRLSQYIAELGKMLKEWRQHARRP